MKKLLVFAFAALTLAACTQERNIDPADPGETTLIASRASTRSALWASDGETLYNILWDAPDSILVAYGGTTPATFRSKNEGPVAEATFVGKLPEGSGTLYGIYPANSSNNVASDGTFSIEFKENQDAVAGSYDPEAFPAVAVSESNNLSFKNICSLLALKVEDDDVVKITLSGNGSSCFYGGTFTVTADGDEPEITDFTEDVYEITLTAEDTFDPAETYFMSVPPIGFEDGVIFTLTHEDGTTNEILLDKAVTAERSKVHTVPTLISTPTITSTILVTNIQIDCVSPEVEVGSSLSLAAVITPGTATNQEVDWSVDDETIGTVAAGTESGTATLTGVTGGKVTITAAAKDGSGVTGTLEVTVIDPYAITMQQLRDDLEEFAPSNLEDLSYGSAKGYQYYSSSAGHNKRVYVLLPPNYDTSKEYPVLFVLHGIFGDESSMLDRGMGVQKMIANAIAEGTTKDMIVIFPQMYTCPTADQPAGFSFDQQTMRYYDKFEDDLLEDLLPWAKENFSIAEGRKNTAITGFSLGGRESLYIGTQHTDVFGFVGAACPAPGILPAQDQFMVHEGTIKNEADFRLKDGNPKPYILLISGGTNDGTVSNYPERYHNILTNNNVDHVWHSISNTGHDGSSVQPHLYNFIRHIFNVE